MRTPVWALALMLAACGAPSSTARAPSGRELELYPVQAEVWSFDVLLHGGLASAGHDALVACTLELVSDGLPMRSFPAAVSGTQFSMRVPLAPGLTTSARAHCQDRHGALLASSPVRLVSKASPAPHARLTASVAGQELRLDAHDSTPNDGTQAPLVAYRWFVEAGSDATPKPLGTGPALTLALPSDQGSFRYTLRVHDAAQHEASARTTLEVAGEDARLVSAGGPSWIDSAVIYGVIPKLFGEPPLARTQAALDDLQQLGIDVLWLSPIFQTPPGDFGYAVTDYFEVRPDYGDQRALEALLQAAHERKIRVVLDLALNDSSAQHRYFRESEAIGKRSHYYPFYARALDGAATHYFDRTQRPNLNFDDAELRAWAIAFSSHWVNLGVDGYRVDTAWGVRQRSPTFYTSWSASLRALNPDLLLLAEAPARDPYYLQNGFDAAYDWGEQLGHHAWENVFAPPEGVAKRLAAELQATADHALRPERTFRFLNNNDTGARFITRHGPGMTTVATVALFTVPGIPCLYTFDELGAAYEPYQQSPPVFGEHAALRALHRKLIALRKQVPALHGESSRALYVGSHDELFVFLRSDAQTDDQALVALNLGPTPVSRILPLPLELVPRVRDSLRDVLSGHRVAVRDARVTLKLPPWGAQILVAPSVH